MQSSSFPVLSSLASYMTSDSSNPTYDPLSTLVKLALLAFKAKGTRLSFDKYSFTYEEPGLYQSAVRTVNRENKSDLVRLEAPITKAVELYHPKGNHPVTVIFESTIAGLQTLHDSYTPPKEGLLYGKKNVQEYQLAQSTILSFKRKLDDALAGSKSDESTKEAPSPIDFKKLWDPQDIKWIAHGFENAKSKQNLKQDYQRVIDAIYIFALGVDKNLADALNAIK